MKYPFDKLEVGQAFNVPVDADTASNLNSLCRYYSRKLGRVFGYRRISRDAVFEVSRRPDGWNPVNPDRTTPVSVEIVPERPSAWNRKNR